MNNITDAQRVLLDTLKSKQPDLEVRWNEERGVAGLLEGNLLSWPRSQEPEAVLETFLQQYGTLLGPGNMTKAYRLTSIKRNANRGEYRIRACQIFDDIPVFGATLLIFAGKGRGVYRSQSSFWREIKLEAKRRIDERELAKQLEQRLRRDPGASKFEASWKEQQPNAWQVEHFPLASYPTLYLYPVRKGFHPVYDVQAYQPTEWLGVDGLARQEINRVQLIFDAVTGELIWQEPTKEGMAYSDQVGDGLSTLQDSNGNYLLRSLRVVRKDSANYYLLNRMHTPEIRTYDMNGNLTVAKLKSDTNLSEDANNHWNSTTTSCTNATRQAAQQPEVDGHFNAEEAWTFYHNLGWDGFDDGAYGAACPLRVAAHIGMDANAYFDKYAEPIPNTTTNKYYGYIAFYDGQCDGTTRKFDFMAGDPVIFGHEFQHAVTFFGAAKSNGEPGHLYWNMWAGAIREGYSDALACLRRGLWTNPPFYPEGAVHPSASGTGAYTLTLWNGSTLTVYPRPFRRVEFPRSSNTYDGNSYCDHYNDRDSTKDKYFHSTLLSHLAYLVGQGGVHQRASRGDAEFIPVTGVGLERTAEIFLYALTQYFDTIPSNLNHQTLIEAAKYILDAAKDVPGGSNRSCEYVMMRRALYALGLYPYDSSYNKQAYGGEACMLPWTYSWRFSQPYLGLPALWWQSLDLFINNNGNAQYKAVVGQENNVFARVRNIGDQDLHSVKVKFYFAPAGTNLPASISGWHTCKNQAGVDCVLDIPTLSASGMNFTDVNNPPADQAVHWYLDPTYVTSQVDHFCLRAVIESNAANHDNDCPNQVQSNVQYEKLPDSLALGINFQVANWLNEPVPLDLRMTHSLPRGYRFQYTGKTSLMRISLLPGKPLSIHFDLQPPKRKPLRLSPPYEGSVTGHVRGKIQGKFTGELTGAKKEFRSRVKLSLKRNIRLSGMLAGIIQTDREKSSLIGYFVGELDQVRGTMYGVIEGDVLTSTGKFSGLKLDLKAKLEPSRAVNFTQVIQGKVVGGISVFMK